MSKYISILVLIFLNFYNLANAEDPFSRSFSTPMIGSMGDPLGFDSMEDVDDDDDASVDTSHEEEDIS